MAAIATSTGAVKTRLAWLDALRGVAAMLVVYEHLTHSFFAEVHAFIHRWFLAGYAGVCLFFVVSGYIIPASLERRGDLRAFWIGRAFRLYPLYLVVLVLLVVLHFAGLRPLDAHTIAHPALTSIAHATMMSTLLGVPDILGVTWTLAFEMTFYLVAAALHAVRLERSSPYVAIMLALASAVAAPLPVERLLAAGDPLFVVVVATLVFGASIAAMVSRRRVLVLAGAIGGVLLSASLLGWNENGAHAGDGLLIPALMFTGTTLHRVEHRQIHYAWALVVPVLVFGAWCVVLQRTVPIMLPPVAITLAFVGTAFAIGWLVRRRTLPRALTWLGLVSYSLYLLHRAVFDTVLPSEPSRAPFVVQALLAAGLVGAVLAACAVTYRFIELPAQRLGRPPERSRAPPAT